MTELKQQIWTDTSKLLMWIWRPSLIETTFRNYLLEFDEVWEEMQRPKICIKENQINLDNNMSFST